MQHKETDGETLARVLASRDFFHRALEADTLEDWELARDLGDLLIRLDSELIVGHALLSRAYRHLGESAQASEGLSICRRFFEEGNIHAAEVELYRNFLDWEFSRLKK